MANSVGYEVEEAPDVIVVKDDDPHYKFVKKERPKELLTKMSSANMVNLRESLPGAS